MCVCVSMCTCVCVGAIFSPSLCFSLTHISSLPHIFYSHKYISIYFHMCVPFLTLSLEGREKSPHCQPWLSMAVDWCWIPVLLPATQPGWDQCTHCPALLTHSRTYTHILFLNFRMSVFYNIYLGLYVYACTYIYFKFTCSYYIKYQLLDITHL